MQNSREARAARNGHYLKASWYAAHHYARLASWAMAQVRQGLPVNFSRV